MMTTQSILLVDDSENDIFLMHRAFKKAEFNAPVHEVHDGEEAIAYLAGEGQYHDRAQFPLPCLIFLDLNMPRKNGFEVLAWIRTQPVFNPIAIVVLTASARPEDIQRTFDLGATYFLVKPSNTTVLATMLQSLRDWTRLNHFPPRNEMVSR